jgi:UDP-N-acetyl-D-mannosaminuronic acid dehydrogenase
VEPEEAELAKLINTRGANRSPPPASSGSGEQRRPGLLQDQSALSHNYPRAAMPSAGCCRAVPVQDTIRLAAFQQLLRPGHSAMLINEGLPLYVVDQLERQHDLATMKVGILGMAFKGESDDTRSSLSYKLRRILRFRAVDVLCTDPYVTSDASLVPVERLLTEADVLIIGAPHEQYRTLQTEKPVVDVWNLRGHGNLV